MFHCVSGAAGSAGELHLLLFCSLIWWGQFSEFLQLERCVYHSTDMFICDRMCLFVRMPGLHMEKLVVANGLLMIM